MLPRPAFQYTTNTRATLDSGLQTSNDNSDDDDDNNDDDDNDGVDDDSDFDDDDDDDTERHNQLTACLQHFHSRGCRAIPERITSDKVQPGSEKGRATKFF